MILRSGLKGPEKRGTMMKCNKCLRNFVELFLCGFFVCSLLTGCGVKDSALVISVDEAAAASDDSTEKGVSEAAGWIRAGEQEAGTQGTAGQDLVEESRSFIYVYVCGAVASPGVVELPEGSRAWDALEAAGGFGEEAQKDYVNLAAKVEDGQKLFFPDREEAEALASAEDAAQKGFVNINTADVAQLMTLPGIGESRAQDIIAYREANGDFQRTEDIKKVSGIKESIYEKLCEKIVVQ